MSDHIPHEVFTDIFTKLTIKDIGRCSCVCKSWYTLITSPAFISHHTKLLLLIASSTPNPPLLLVRDYDSFYSSSEIHLKEHYSLHYDTEKLEKHIDLNPPFQTSWINNNYTNIRVIGCVNGVVCLSNDLITYTDDIILWNPSIGKALTLPRPLVSFESHGSFVHSIGFGFNPSSNDFKVVRVVHFIDYWDDEVPPHVEVYNLRVGYWRSINHLMRTPCVIIDQCSPQAFLNGAIHWVGSDSDDAKSKRIVSFDLVNEEFSAMKVPVGVTADERSLDVCVLGELLSLICYKRSGGHRWSGGNRSCEVWVMEEYGVCDSWVRRFTVDVTGQLAKVVGFRRNGVALLERMGRGTGLTSFDPGSRRVKNVDSFARDRSFDVECFVESLALLDVKATGESLKKKKAGSDTRVISKGYLNVHVQKKMKMHWTADKCIFPENADEENGRNNMESL